MKKLRDYQIEISNKSDTILKRLKLVFLICEVRTGKTLMALNTARLYGAKNVLFLTKKKAISSIKNDYNDFRYSSDYQITIINNESLHKVEGDFDFIVMDESHRFGSFPKPCKMAKDFKKRFSHLPIVMMTGTFHPESYSQIFHQFWVSDYSPFKEPNFYKWAKTYVRVKDRHLGYAVVKDYSDGIKELINPVIEPYILTFTQKEAGFETEVKENVIKVKMKDITYQIANKLKKDLFIVSKNGSEIIADTAVKLMQKLHQIYSGTVLFEDGTYRIFDTSKAEFIKERFKGKRLGIFYKFKAEYDLLKQIFGQDLSNNLEDFNNGVKHIALQIVSGSEGISLSNADYLIYYNIDFSAKNYWQSRDRLTTMERTSNDVFWIFSDRGIEEKIYDQVMNKKNFTLNVFKRYYDIPTRNNQTL